VQEAAHVAQRDERVIGRNGRYPRSAKPERPAQAAIVTARVRSCERASATRCLRRTLRERARDAWRKRRIREPDPWRAKPNERHGRGSGLARRALLKPSGMKRCRLLAFMTSPPPLREGKRRETGALPARPPSRARVSDDRRSSSIPSTRRAKIPNLRREPASRSSSGG